MAALLPWPVSTSLRSLAGSVRDALEALHADLAAIDPGLEKTAARTGATIGAALAKLRGRAERAVAARHPDRLRRLRRLRSALRPDGAQ